MLDLYELWNGLDFKWRSDELPGAHGIVLYELGPAGVLLDQRDQIVRPGFVAARRSDGEAACDGRSGFQITDLRLHHVGILADLYC